MGPGSSELVGDVSVKIQSQAPPWILLHQRFKKRDGVCISSKSLSGISWCANWLCSWEYLCVLSLTHVACLMPVNYSHEQSTARPRWLRDQAVLSVAALFLLPFARIIILTQRGISQLLLTMKEEPINTAPKELLFQTFSLPHCCALLLHFYLFILILLRILGQTFCEDEINSLLHKSFLNSVFLWGKRDSCCLFCIQNCYWYSVYWFFTFEKNKLLQSWAGGQDTALIQPHVPVSFGKLSLCS